MYKEKNDAPNPTHSAVPPLGRADSFVFILQVAGSVHSHTDMGVSVMLLFPFFTPSLWEEVFLTPKCAGSRVRPKSDLTLAVSHGKWG